MPRFQRVHLVVNPASGPAEPPTQVLRALLAEARVSWQMHTVTKRADPVSLAQRAVEDGADVVVACGGDGTVRAVAIALEGTDVPLGIIPTGSANILSKDLGIPANPEAALRLILADDARTGPLDLGCIESSSEADGRFILRIGVGWVAAWTQTVPEDEKDALGRWAYLRHALRLRRDLVPQTYRMVIDGERVEAEGVTLLVCNSVNVGLPGFSVLPGASPSDGKLHIVVLKEADWLSIAQLTGRTLASPLHDADAPPEQPAPGAVIAHWSAERITVEATGEDPVGACDGEAFPHPLPFTAAILPSALRVVVPPILA